MAEEKKLRNCKQKNCTAMQLAEYCPGHGKDTKKKAKEDPEE